MKHQILWETFEDLLHDNLIQDSKISLAMSLDPKKKKDATMQVCENSIVINKIAFKCRLSIIRLKYILNKLKWS